MDMNKKVADLTSEDMLDILTEMRDTETLDAELFKHVLKHDWVLHNYLNKVGLKLKQLLQG